jgi:hypothetical protein
MKLVTMIRDLFADGRKPNPESGKRQAMTVRERLDRINVLHIELTNAANPPTDVRRKWLEKRIEDLSCVPREEIPELPRGHRLVVLHETMTPADLGLPEHDPTTPKGDQHL